MSMDLGGAKGGVKSDINVTPLVDVMLVLLIIMMLITPMLNQGGAVTLPKATNTVDKPTTQDNTVVTPDVSEIVRTYTADRRISGNKTDVTLPEREKKRRDIYEQRKDKKIFLMGAGTLRYKDIIDVIDAAKGAGVEQVGIVTEGMQKAAGAGN